MSLWMERIVGLMAALPEVLLSFCRLFYCHASLLVKVVNDLMVYSVAKMKDDFMWLECFWNSPYPEKGEWISNNDIPPIWHGMCASS